MCRRAVQEPNSIPDASLDYDKFFFGSALKMQYNGCLNAQRQQVSSAILHLCRQDADVDVWRRFVGDLRRDLLHASRSQLLTVCPYQPQGKRSWKCNYLAVFTCILASTQQLALLQGATCGTRRDECTECQQSDDCVAAQSKMSCLHGMAIEVAMSGV